MNSSRFCSLASRLLRHPSAPYFERAVRAEAEKICSENGLEYECDYYGNLLIRLRSAKSSRPLVLAAHIDHPGFEVIRRIGPSCWLVRFRGNVPKGYFRKGVPVRLMPGAVPARLGARRKGKVPIFEVITARRPPLGQLDFAVWELEDYQLRNGRIYARACDDLVGAAVVLATLIELKRARARVHVTGVLSRAEEVGFHGALALAANSTRPKRQRRPGYIAADSLVISLETSRELPGVKIGNGVIVRVGDKASVFDSEATRFLTEVAVGLQQRQPHFMFQRALMSGGTCEATAYQQFGFRSTAVCVALGNYHNCGSNNGLVAEYVSLADALAMKDLLVESAKRMREYRHLTGQLPARLRRLLAEAQRGLSAA